MQHAHIANAIADGSGAVFYHNCDASADGTTIADPLANSHCHRVVACAHNHPRDDRSSNRATIDGNASIVARAVSAAETRTYHDSGARREAADSPTGYPLDGTPGRPP
jgi:hypothetical protein